MLEQVTSAPSIPPGGLVIISEAVSAQRSLGLISQHSSKLNPEEFLGVPAICCDICSLFVLTETLQVQANCRGTSRAGS